jgi:hypothetical protein
MYSVTQLIKKEKEFNLGLNLILPKPAFNIPKNLNFIKAEHEHT